jgi:hypothetical protein
VETLFYFLSIVQIALGLYLVFQGLQWLGYARRRAGTDPGFYAPRTAVLCSCKGLEPGLERNLTALTEFDHQNYETFFVLASESDPACAIVKRVAATARTKGHVVIADKPEGCGEKVNNLRFAIEQLPADFEFLAFADSDGRPGKSWLKKLVAPLSDARVGATTTMRWLIPNRSNLATVLLAAWNAPIVTMLSEKGKNFCWGGGMAIRRSVFDQIGVVEDWKFGERRLLADPRSATGQPADYVRAGVFDVIVRGERFRGIAGVHEPADSNYAGVRAGDVGVRAGHARVVLPYADPGSVFDAGRCDRDAPGVSSCDFDISTGFAGRYPQHLAGGRGHGSAAGGALADHGAGVDLYSIDDLHSVPVCGELRDLADHTEDPVAEHHLRVDLAGTDAHSHELKAKSDER